MPRQQGRPGTSAGRGESFLLVLTGPVAELAARPPQPLGWFPPALAPWPAGAGLGPRIADVDE